MNMNTLVLFGLFTAVFGGSVWSFTLCADTVQDAGNHYDVHSLYGWFQSEPTLM